MLTSNEIQSRIWRERRNVVIVWSAVRERAEVSEGK
jgi:hypothetical protein